MDKAKQQIVETVDAAREDLLALSKNIHDNPELGFQEFKAMGFISDTLEKAWIYGSERLRRPGNILPRRSLRKRRGADGGVPGGV